MDPIADLAALRPIIDSLAAKHLIVSLTPPGRGHVLTHALYQPQELEKLRREYHAAASPLESTDATTPSEPRRANGGSASSQPLAAAIPAATATASAALQREMQTLRAELNQLRTELEELSERQRRTDDELQQMKVALGGS